MDQMWKMRERRFKNVFWVFACAAGQMVMPFTEIGKLHEAYFGEKIEFCFRHIKFEMPV